MKRPEVLNSDEIQNFLNRFHDWKIREHQLEKEFIFQSYMEGLEFVNKVAKIAESLDHHPDISLGYKKVKVKTSTHEPKGFTTLDFDLIRSIEEM